MPFDGSGNFSRLYNWQSDRDNGIKILAARMDGEFDNFAAGMNVVFFRNGLVPMSGNLNLGTNYITGLGSGSVGALPVRFADDPNTGVFLNGYNNLGFVTNGVLRGQFTNVGLSVVGNSNITGTLNAVGAITQNGQQVWHAGNFTPGNYAPLSGATFTGDVYTNGKFRTGSAGTTGQIQFARSSDGAVVGSIYWGANSTTGPLTIDNLNNGEIALALGGSTKVLVQPATTTVVNNLAVNGILTSSGGFPVWNTGNFNPANYAYLAANNSFTGNIQSIDSNGTPAEIRLAGYGYAGSQLFKLRQSVQGVSNGGFSIENGSLGTVPFYIDASGNTVHSGGVAAGGSFTPQAWMHSKGAGEQFRMETTIARGGGSNYMRFTDPSGTAGYIGYTGANNTLDIHNALSGIIQFVTAGVARANIDANGVATFNSNVNPAGQVNSGNGFRATGHNSTGWTGAGVTLSYSGGGILESYNYTGGAYAPLLLAASTLTLSADTVKNGAGGFLYHNGSGLSGKVTRGTAAPSGGSDGDIYLQYT